MKIVREILYEKFSEEGDPVSDMGIGMNIDIITKEITREDKKHRLIVNAASPGQIEEFVVTGAVGRNKQHLVGSYFKIIFWGNDLYFPAVKNNRGVPVRKRMMFRDKAKYADQLIKDAGFGDFFSDYNWNPHDKGVINFRIKPEFRGFFKPGHYKVS
jgi:hypothetical protein